MEKKTEKLTVNNELRAFLGSGLVQYGEDVLNSEVSRHDIIIQLLISQKNNALGIQRAIEDKQKRGIKLSKETLQKLQKFMDQNRFSPLIGYGWKSEEQAIEFLVDMGLKTGKPFLDKLLDSEYFQSVTSTMKEETFEDESLKKKAIEKAFREENENGC